MDIAIDASVLVGLFVRNDVWHAQAVDLWMAVKLAGHTAVIFDCVVAETVSVAVRRLREKGRATDIPDFMSHLSTELPYEAITWILPTVPRLYSQVLEIIGTSSGDLNFHDGLLALCCRERGIPSIASYDSDFDLLPWLRRVSTPADLQMER